MGANLSLDYKEGNFELRGAAPFSRMRDAWEKTGRGVFVTVNARVAADFRAYATQSAENALSRKLVARYTLPARPLPVFLDRHQVQGVKWALTRGRSYLAHAPGAGKTLEALTTGLFALGPGQVLFVVPPSLTVNWKREIERFAPRVLGAPGGKGVLTLDVLRPSIVPESAKRTELDWDALILICPDSMLHKEWVKKELTRRTFRLVAVDEASRFKEPTAVRTIALFGGRSGRGKRAFRSPGLARRARHVVLLDGSPISKRPIEIWAPVFALSPESIDFRSRSSFGHRYCAPTMNSYGRVELRGSAREEELGAKLTKDFMHVVPESALGHAERRRSMIFLNDVRTKAQRRWEEKNLSTITFDDISEETSQGDLARHRAELGMQKVKWVAKRVRERLEGSDESFILFAWHRPVVLALARELHKYRPGVILGGVKSSVREKIFADFQSRKRRLIIGNLAAMGRGNNLQVADRIGFAEWAWSDETNKQAEKRASRRGRAQAKTVRCEYYVSAGTLDEIVLRSVFRGARNVRRIIGE